MNEDLRGFENLAGLFITRLKEQGEGQIWIISPCALCLCLFLGLAE